MDISGTRLIPAGREKVWDALNDPDVLKACIPGCESLEKTSDTEMNASVTTKIGPVKAKFKGAVTLENINAPESYTIVGEGKGGVAGFAKGSADVKLSEEGEETVLTYEAKAQVGGKLAQLGSRLVDSTAKKMAEDFFSKFTEMVGTASEPTVEAPATGDELDAGVAEEAKRIAIEEAPGEVLHAIEEAEHAVEETLQKAEENLEVAAGRSAFGGPMVWGLALLGVLILVLALAS
ncbi:MAG: carbon monoxide dehydrogenase subunit G [Pseudomonadota bacterium]